MWRFGHRAVILAVVVAGSLWAATTTVTQRVLNPDGTLASGTAYIRESAACQSGTDYVGANTVAVRFSNGSFSVNLLPNDTCVPHGTSYLVVWALSGGRTWSETWVVPTSSSPVAVSSVVQMTSVPAPPAQLQLNQIAQGGASTGQVMGWNGSMWGPTTPAPGGVTSWNARSGAVVPVSGDYSVSQITGLTTALAGKIAKSSTAAFAEDYCAVALTYDQTCIANAASAANVVVVDHVYTFGAKVTIAGKTGFMLVGLPGSKIVAANGLNTDMLEINTCSSCSVENVIFDGNRANQTATSNILKLQDNTHILIKNSQFLHAHDSGIANTYNTAWGLEVRDNVFNDNGSSDVSSTNTAVPLTAEAIVGNKFIQGNALNLGPNYGQAIYLNRSSAFVVTGNTIIQSSNWNYASFVNVDTSGTGTVLANVVSGSWLPFGLVYLTNGASSLSVVQSVPTQVAHQYPFNAAACTGAAVTQLLNTIPSGLTGDCSNPIAPGIQLSNSGTNYVIVRVPNPANLVSGSGMTFNFNYFVPSSVTVAALNVIADYACIGTGDSLASVTWTNVLNQNYGLNMVANAAKSLNFMLSGTAMAACAGKDIYARMGRGAQSGGIFYTNYIVITGGNVTWSTTLN